MSGGNNGAPAPTAPSGEAGSPTGPNYGGMDPSNPYYQNRPGGSVPADSPYAPGAPNTGNMNYLPGFASGQAQRPRGNNFDTSNLFNAEWQQQFGRSQYGDAYGQEIPGSGGATIGGNAAQQAGRPIDLNNLQGGINWSDYGGTAPQVRGRQAELQQVHAPVYNQYARNAMAREGYEGPAFINRGGDYLWFRGMGADGQPIYASPATGNNLTSSAYQALVQQGAIPGGAGAGPASAGAPQSMAAPQSMGAPQAPQPNSLYSMPAGGVGTPNPYDNQGPLYGVI